VVVDEMRVPAGRRSGGGVSVFTVNGFNFAGRGQSSGMAFIMLKPGMSVTREQRVRWPRAQQHFFSFRDAMVFAFARRRYWSWVTPPVSTCSCRTAPVSVTKS
jgi:multidrug efflux pump